MLKVFLGGEGRNDIGTRGRVTMGDQMGDQVGVVEVLLRRARPEGWKVSAAMEWQSIRKYRAGKANEPAAHHDAHNVRALVLRAYEEACEMLAFVRDIDGERLREQEIRRVLETIDSFGFAQEYGYQLAVVGGVAVPTLEAWILCLLGGSGTDELSKAGAERALAKTDVKVKSSADYLAVAKTCALPTGGSSLAEWLDRARKELDRLIDGTPAEVDR